MEKLYRARRDGVFTGLLWACVLFCAWGVLDVLGGTPPGAARVALLILVAGTAVLCLWTLYGTRYVLTRDRLRIRCGPFRSSIPLADIRAVVPVRNLLSGAALAVDRLHVQTRRGAGAFISPADRERFLQDLRTREPRLVAEGDRLVRR
jgi:hypothetical protein